MGSLFSFKNVRESVPLVVKISQCHRGLEADIEQRPIWEENHGLV